MTDRQHEAVDTGSSITRLRSGEIFAILAFWAFLVVLTAAGLLIDPRVAAVAAMRAALRPEVTSGIDRIALAEYGLWAGLTLPIFWMALGGLIIGSTVHLGDESKADSPRKEK